jgi:hypothetical protein
LGVEDLSAGCEWMRAEAEAEAEDAADPAAAPPAA